MKEIIKYLRQLNSFTQDEAATKLGITRQSYIKYENGSVTPSEKMIEKMAVLYKVSTDYIHENKLPQPGKSDVYYQIDPNYVGFVTEETPAYSAFGRKTYDAWFDGNAIRINDANFKFTKGQRFKIIVEDEEETIKRKKEAWENIKKIIRENVKPYPKGPDEDPFYKEALMEALNEKYNSIN